ncbi:hypothetical protein KC19_4G034200 [Ceratodon purpureus]|uniref:Uncharacterized protein n=1 Tax=Ceratodon purpureus TaxID=3225 RepID=A0A8T0I7W3_CERPU|nr:hypothetical protein KC19_4G034200 [Ceratodon purpureus]
MFRFLFLPKIFAMSQFGKEPDPNKGGAGGAQKDCDSCGNRDHVQKASKGDNWDKTKTSDLSGAAARASADRAAEDKGGVLGP